jgi:hypothetical protein
MKMEAADLLKNLVTIYSITRSHIAEGCNLHENVKSHRNISLHFSVQRIRDGAVGIATGYMLDGRSVGIRVPAVSQIFAFPCRPDRLWGPPSPLSNEYLEGALSPGIKRPAHEGTTHLQLLPRSRKCGFIHPLPHTPSWRSA